MQKSAITENPKERVLITGNAGALGRELTKKLLKIPGLKLFGVDRRPYLDVPEGLEHHALDLRRKSAIDLLRKIKPHSIIHLGVIRSPQVLKKKSTNAYYFNLESTSQLLRLAESLNLRKFVFLSTANLYGPSATTSGMLTEEAALHGSNRSPEVRDLVVLDMMMQSFFWKQPNTQTVILRPCHIVGPHLRNAPSRYLSLETIPTILGFDPILQLIHESDLIDAIILSLRSEVRGIFNLAGLDQAPLSRIIKHLKRPSLPLPERLLKAFAAGTFFSRRSTFPSSEVDHLKYSCLIETTRAAEELGFKPKWDLAHIIEEQKEAFEKAKKNRINP